MVITEQQVDPESSQSGISCAHMKTIQVSNHPHVAFTFMESSFDLIKDSKFSAASCIKTSFRTMIKYTCLRDIGDPYLVLSSNEPHNFCIMYYINLTYMRKRHGFMITYSISYLSTATQMHNTFNDIDTSWLMRQDTPHSLLQ